VASDQVIQQDVVLQPSAGGVQVSGTITNFMDLAPKNSDGVVVPFNLVDYSGGLTPENGPNGPIVIAYDAGRQWTAADMIQPDRSFTAMGNVSDGYQDYFQASAVPAGRYTLTLPTGPQTLQAMAPVTSQGSGGSWSAVFSDPVTINGKAGQSLTDSLTILKGTATISGDIAFPADYNGGNVVSDSSMFLFLRPATADNSFFGRAVGEPDPAGHYSLADIPAGNYYLYVYGLGLTPWISDLITVTAGQAVVENVDMGFGGVVSGTITAGSAPLAGATVSSRNTGFSVVTDQDGHYQLPGFLVGGDTMTVSKAGLVAKSIDITLAANEQRNNEDVDLVMNPSSITGLVDGGDNEPISGGTVVAYDTVTGEQYSTTTVDGHFTFTGLASSQYVLGAHADGMTTATYPGGADTLALDPGTAMDLTTSPILLSYVGPSFSVSSSVAAGKLSITFHTDMPLKAMPTVTLAGGAGVLGALAQVNTTTYVCAYTPAAGDSVAQIRIAESEAKAIVPGSPVSKTFGFDVAATLVEQEGTTFYNAQGASADMMGAQDNSTVYVPPFALAGGDATSAITLTATRYGDPGAQLGDAKAVTGVYEFNFTKDGQDANVQLAHQATVTLSFKLPVGMTPAEFETTLKVGYKNDSLSPPVWVWNDLANSNAASGISDIRINWASDSITFSASHFTAFAAATDAETLDVTTTGLPVNYLDADGTKVKVVLRSGQGLLHFTGIGMTQTTTSAGITVSGSSLKLDTVTLSNTSAALSSLTFTTTGGHFPGTAVGAITGTPLSSLAASTVTLDGDGISIPTGAITAVKLSDLDNGADITMGAAAKAVSLTYGAIGGDSLISVTGAIQSLTAVRWDSGTLTADSLAGLTVAGGFGASVVLSGAGKAAQALGKATIGGQITSTDWDINGKVGTVTAGGVNGLNLHSTAHTLTGVTTFNLGDVTSATVDVDGPVTTVQAKRWLAGSVHADTIGSLQVLGDKAKRIPGQFGADLTLDGTAIARLSALGAAKVTGNITGAGAATGGITGGAWNVTGNTGTITADSIAQSWVATFAGSVTALTSNGDAGGQVTANKITTLKFAAGLTNSKIVLTDPVPADNSLVQAAASFSVAGRMDDSTFVSAGNVGTISVGAMRDSNVYVGLPDTTTGLPANGAFDALAAARRPGITSATVSGMKGAPTDSAFENSNIAAWKIGSVLLTNVVKDTPGSTTPFGIAANKLTSYKRKQGTASAYSLLPTAPWPTDDGFDFSVAKVT
jgi:hypothetical protein